MNIVVRTSGGHFVVRPDTTREKNSEDFWLPDDVSHVSWSPVFFVRISRAGKRIGTRYAGRYYDLFSFGVLLYPEDFIGSCEEGFAMASCMDRTSYLPMPDFAFAQEADGQAFRVTTDGCLECEHKMLSRGALDNAVSEASRHILLRPGDYLAIELQPRSPLFAAPHEDMHVEAEFMGRKLLSFSIKSL